jgi:hypothetical protein
MLVAKASSGGKEPDKSKCRNSTLITDAFESHFTPIQEQGIPVDLVQAVKLVAYPNVNNANLSKSLDRSSILFKASDWALTPLFRDTSVVGESSNISSRNDRARVGCALRVRTGVEVIGRGVSLGVAEAGCSDKRSVGDEVLGGNVGLRLGDTTGFGVGLKDGFGVGSKDGFVDNIGDSLGLSLEWIERGITCSADEAELLPLVFAKDETTPAIPPAAHAMMNRMTAGQRHL